MCRRYAVRPLSVVCVNMPVFSQHVLPKITKPEQVTSASHTLQQSVTGSWVLLCSSPPTSSVFSSGPVNIRSHRFGGSGGGEDGGGGDGGGGVGGGGKGGGGINIIKDIHYYY